MIYYFIVGIDLPNLQESQAVQFQPGGSVDRLVNFTVTDDSAVECEETFRLKSVSMDPNLLQIDSTYGEVIVSIIDDDGGF